MFDVYSLTPKFCCKVCVYVDIYIHIYIYTHTLECNRIYITLNSMNVLLGILVLCDTVSQFLLNRWS